MTPFDSMGDIILSVCSTADVLIYFPKGDDRERLAFRIVAYGSTTIGISNMAAGLCRRISSLFGREWP
jgi:hypothetical protein